MHSIIPVAGISSNVHCERLAYRQSSVNHLHVCFCKARLELFAFTWVCFDAAFHFHRILSYITASSGSSEIHSEGKHTYCCRDSKWCVPARLVPSTRRVVFCVVDLKCCFNTFAHISSVFSAIDKCICVSSDLLAFCVEFVRTLLDGRHSPNINNLRK